MCKVLLYSGGMDSYIIDKLWKPDVKLFIDYGTEQTKIERSKLTSDVVILDFPELSKFIEDDGKNTIPLRNLIFASLAVNYGDVICIGGVAGDTHADNSYEFCKKTTDLFNFVLSQELSRKSATVCVPFREYTKTELLRMYIKEGYSLDEFLKNSSTCYNPINGKDCGECLPCKRKYEAVNTIRKEISCGLI